MKNDITRERLRHLLDYDPASGIFIWKKSSGPRARVGSVAGSVDKSTGYIVVRIGGKGYKAHRLAFLYMEGQFPPADVDHINGIKTDNRWCNLRNAENWQNQGNHKGFGGKSGIRGVDWRNASKKWRVRIHFDGRSYSLGYYDDPAIATAVYQGAASLIFGPFAHHQSQGQ